MFIFQNILFEYLTLKKSYNINKPFFFYSYYFLNLKFQWISIVVSLTK